MARYYVVNDYSGECYTNDGYTDLAFAEEVCNRLNRESDNTFAIYSDEEMEEMEGM